MKRSNDDSSAGAENDKTLTIAFLYGRQYERLKAQCEGFAESIGSSGPEVTYRMGALLSGTKEVWELLGPSNSVQLRRSTAKGSKKSRRRVEVGNKPRKKSLNSKGKAVTHPYWSKLTPEQRSKEMARRMAARKKKAA